MNFKRLSASSIKCYRQCPYQFHLHYNLELPEEGDPHPLTLMGSSLHLMCEKATRARMVDWETNPQNPDCNPLTHKLEACKEFKVHAEHMPLLDQFVTNLNTWGYWRNIARCAGAEIEFDFTLTDNTPIKGYIDRLDLWNDTADIIDLKTQRNVFEPEELLHNWQARIYNIAVRKMYPQVTNKVAVSFWVVRHQVQKVHLTAVDATNDLLELVKVSQEIKSCVDPEPKPSALCQWCGWKKHCPMATANIKTKLQAKMKGTVVFK